MKIAEKAEFTFAKAVQSVAKF